MKIHKLKNALIISALAAGLILFANPIAAQRTGSTKSDTRITYHDGPVLPGRLTIYTIFYGNWPATDNTPWILSDLASSISGSPYFMINTTYPSATGSAPSGATLYAGSVSDQYSQGPSLTNENIKQIIEAQILSGALPLDSTGIYIVVGSSDVTDIQPDGSTFCTPGSSPHHGYGVLDGTFYMYGYLGGANRCPTSAGPQFVAPDGTLLPTPNDNFAADAMASSLLHILNAAVTNPLGYGGWYDRYGLENADKCLGKFGTTFLAPNGATANIILGGRYYLIQQNWLNDRRGRCVMSIAE
jgi:hypothetical protein